MPSYKMPKSLTTCESQPVAPTASLPPLARLSGYSTRHVEHALTNLRIIYASCPLPILPAPVISLPKHVIHDASVPDSGYASAEEDEVESLEHCRDNAVDEEPFDIDVLRSDVFEREFAIRWLTALTARSDTWAYDCGVSEEEQNARARLVDEAASLLASFAGDNDEEEALTRTFTFPVGGDRGTQSGTVDVELNDAPLLSEDHTSVGLQSWGSSIIFAERLCAEPWTFGFSANDNLRILELGAGTGLLSIVAAKLSARYSYATESIATDYHPQVLENLRLNIRSNFASTSPVTVASLDWQSPAYRAPLDKSFDIIVAADVIYHPDHARWIKSCVERLLRRPTQRCKDADSSDHDEGGIFWLIIPIRSTGRHEGMADTIEEVFRSEATVLAGEGAMELGVRCKEGMGKHEGIGRADESSYNLFKIGWVKP